MLAVCSGNVLVTAVDPKKQQTRLKQILECKDLQLIIVDHLTNPVDKYIANNIFSSLTLLQQHQLIAQQIKRQLDKDTNLLIERKGDAPPFTTSYFPTPHARNRCNENKTPPSPEPRRQDSLP